MRSRALFALPLLLTSPVAILAACGDSSTTSTTSSSSGTGTGGGSCSLSTDQATFAVGDPQGSTDPFGAKAAKQARAGKIKAADVKQPAHGRQKIHDGDFALVNDKIAVIIEQKRPSDGYNRFGGEILAMDLVGDDGKMEGLSTFVESMPGFSIYVPDPTDVSVMNDGSDGKAAVIRVSGPLHAIPFLSESFGGLFPTVYNDLQGAYEYVLEPGAEKITFRLGIINNTDQDIDVGINKDGSDEFLGYFQYSHNQLVTPEGGYGAPSKTSSAFVGFDGGQVGFAYQAIGKETLQFGGLDISGFQLFTGEGFIAKSCSQTLKDRHEIVVGGPQYDGLREAVRRANAQPAWHAVTGKVTDSSGKGLAGAYVHVTDAKGAYLSRTVSGADGSYTVHIPTDTPSKLIPQLRGYPTSAGTSVSATTSSQDLKFDPTGMIHVVTKDTDSDSPMPSRIHVIPKTAKVTATPASYGFDDEDKGRLYQVFSPTGEELLAAAPGDYEVVVAHGPEWEVLDSTVTVVADETVEVPASLLHSVDTKNVMCSDFHIHSFESADSNDPVDYKVKNALADGLELPFSSEHEWVVDFEPIIESFSDEKWAHGFPSEELTTFKWGHFGVVPLTPKPDQRNNGAMEWVGMDPKAVFTAVKALPEKPMLIVNHPDSQSFQGYFTQAAFDSKLGKGTNELWADNFDAIEVFNSSDLESNRTSSLNDWFSMLNHGGTYWAVGSSDCHHSHNCTVGYPRTCMQLGTDDPQAVTADDVRDAAIAGHSTIDGGLYMTVEGPDGAAPGSMMPKTSKATFTVTIQAPSWITLGNPKLETFVNGVSTQTDDLLPIGTFEPGKVKKFTNQVTVTLDMSKRSYVVFHAKGDGDLAPVLPGLNPFAASNPIYFQ